MRSTGERCFISEYQCAASSILIDLSNRSMICVYLTNFSGSIVGQDLERLLAFFFILIFLDRRS